MLHFQTPREALPLIKALSSDTRVAILELLTERGPMRMTAIAEELQITGGALTTHIKLLNEAGVLSIEARSGRHGIQKICRVNDERIVVESPFSRQGQQAYEAEVDIGQFVDVDVTAGASCGMATADRLVHPDNDPACFTGPERVRAGVLWMSRGSLEYIVPNFLRAGQQPNEVQVVLEAGPGLPDQREGGEGEMLLRLNGKVLGKLPLPRESEEQYGMYNPAWWNQRYRQGGVSRTVTVDAKGTFADGERISDVTLSDLNLPGKRSMALTLEAPEGSGGFTLYGQGFGSLAHGIRVRTYYKDQSKAAKNGSRKKAK